MTGIIRKNSAARTICSVDVLGQNSGGPMWTNADVGLALTATVRVVMTGPEAGTIACEGLKVQLSVAAMPAQLKLTRPETPLVEASDTLKFAELPTAMVAEVPGVTLAVIVPTTSVAAPVIVLLPKLVCSAPTGSVLV